MEARGYKALDGKVQGNHGIDHVFVKHHPDGTISEICLCESKTDTSRLAEGQMSDDWIDEQIRRMKADPSPEVRKTGELLEKHRALVKKELWHHDTRTGMTTVSALGPDGKPAGVKAEFSTKRQQRKLLEARAKTRQQEAGAAKGAGEEKAAGRLTSATETAPLKTKAGETPLSVERADLSGVDRAPFEPHAKTQPVLVSREPIAVADALPETDLSDVRPRPYERPPRTVAPGDEFASSPRPLPFPEPSPLPVPRPRPFPIPTPRPYPAPWPTTVPHLTSPEPAPYALPVMEPSPPPRVTPSATARAIPDEWPALATRITLAGEESGGRTAFVLTKVGGKAARIAVPVAVATEIALRAGSAMRTEADYEAEKIDLPERGRAHAANAGGCIGGTAGAIGGGIAGACFGPPGAIIGVMVVGAAGDYVGSKVGEVVWFVAFGPIEEAQLREQHHLASFYGRTGRLGLTPDDLRRAGFSRLERNAYAEILRETDDARPEVVSR